MSKKQSIAITKCQLKRNIKKEVLILSKEEIMAGYRNICPFCNKYVFKKLHTKHIGRVIGLYHKNNNQTEYYEDRNKFDYEDRCKYCDRQIGFNKIA